MEKELHNEKEWVLRMAKGDEAAFRVIFDKLVAPLQYYARRLIHRQQEAEDMVSFAFHKLWENREGFIDWGALRSFLYVTVRRQCIDWVRHQSVADAAHRELMQAQVTDDNYAETKFLQAELLRLVYEEIRALPERYRTILEWSFIEELSTAEMASRLGRSEGHVRADRSRGLVLLRTTLRNKGLLQLAISLYLLWKEQGV